MKRTPWFGGLQCPVREGVYERKLYDYHRREPLVVYAYWDTKQWYVGGYTPEEAMLLAEKYGPTMTLYREWRGLLKEDDDEQGVSRRHGADQPAALHLLQRPL